MTNLLFIVLFCLATHDASAQEFHFPPAEAQDDTVLSQTMLHSATQVIAAPLEGGVRIAQKSEQATLLPAEAPCT